MNFLNARQLVKEIRFECNHIKIAAKLVEAINLKNLKLSDLTTLANGFRKVSMHQRYLGNETQDHVKVIF